MKKSTIDNFKYGFMFLFIISISVKLILQGHWVAVLLMFLFSFGVSAIMQYFDYSAEERLIRQCAKILKESRQKSIVKDDVWRCKIANSTFLRYGELGIVETVTPDMVTVQVASSAAITFSRQSFLESYERTLLKRKDVGFAGPEPKITKSTISL